MNFNEHLQTLTATQRKQFGATYTPEWITELIVTAAYDAWDKPTPPRVHDYGCGTGRFLHAAIKLWRWTENPLDWIAGCDVDAKAVAWAQAHNLPAHHASMFDWATECDIVIGNPPYVRIQNLDASTRQQVQALPLTGRGDSDLYLAALELALRNASIVCMITPSSWMHSKTAHTLREWISSKQLLHTLWDYGDAQLFDDVQTYVAIALFKECDETKIWRDDSWTTLAWPRTVDQLTRSVDLSGTPLFDLCDIRVGLATLADRVFLVDEPLPHTVPCVKASRTVVDRRWIIYPYDNGKPVPESSMDPTTLAYLTSHRDRLEARSSTGPLWYTYGRTQGFNCYPPKILIPPTQLNTHGMRLDDTFCFYISGYAAFPTNCTLDELDHIFSSPQMHEFVHTHGKPMANGWRGINKTILAQMRVR